MSAGKHEGPAAGAGPSEHHNGLGVVSSHPTIPVLLAEPLPDGRVRVWCGWCRESKRAKQRGRWHYHGGGENFDAAEGHRGAHCIDEESPYYRTGYYLRLRRPEDG